MPVLPIILTFVCCPLGGLKLQGLMERAVKILTKFPFPVLYCLGDILCFVMSRIVRYRRKMIMKNLRASFPDKDEKELRKLCRGYYHHLADVFVEIIKFYGMSDEEMKRHVTFENLDELAADMATGRPCMALTTHHCNWEVPIAIPLWLPEGSFVSHVYKRLADKKSDDLMIKVRDRFGSHSVEGGAVLRFLARETKQQKSFVIGFPADQCPTNDILHYWTTFLNQDTAVLDSPERLARRFRMPGYFLGTRKLKRGYYQCYLVKICNDVSQTPEFYLTERYARLLEQSILEQPQYYFWSHNRWKAEHVHEQDGGNNS